MKTEPQGSTPQPFTHAARRLWVGAFVLVGFTSVVAQTLLLRELVTVFYGNELSLGAILAGWLLWGALGSWLAGRSPRSLSVEVQRFVSCQALVTLILPLQVLTIRSIKALMGIAPGELVGLIPMLAWSLVCLAPIATTLGFQFTLGCRIRAAEGGDRSTAIALVYVTDAVGDLIGGIVFAYVLVSLLNSFSIAVLLGMLNLGTGVSIILSGFAIRHRTLMLVALAALIPLLLVVPRAEQPTMAVGWEGQELVETSTSIYGHLAVTAQGDLRSLYQNGILSLTVPDERSAEEMVHIPMLQLEHPQSVALVGGGGPDPVRELLKYPIEELHYVELDREAVRLQRDCIPSRAQDPFVDPRVHIWSMDGRRWIKAYHGQPLDCVLINVGDPYTAEVSRYYSVEFFQELTRSMSVQGVVRVAVTSNENYLSTSMLDFNGCIYWTMREVFSHVMAIPGEELVLVGSMSPLCHDDATLGARLDSLAISTRFVNRHTLPFMLYPERMEFIHSQLEDTPVTINHDLHPVAYYYAMVLWAGYFHPTILETVRLTQRWLPWIVMGVAAALLVPWFWVRRKRLWAVPVAVGVLGCSGMIAEIVLIYSFQVVYGYVYHRVGVIIAAFMIGLVSGTIAGDRWRGDMRNDIKSLALTCMIMAAYGLALLPVLNGVRLVHPDMLGSVALHVIFPLLTAAAGSIVGFAFPVANRVLIERGRDLGRVAGSLYAMDLIGGCLGALAASIVLIPLIGMLWTCGVLAGIALLSSLLLLLTESRA